MAFYAATISTPLSQTEAWSRLSDVTRFSEWNPGVVTARKIGEGSGSGAAYMIAVKGIRRNIEIRYDVVHFSAPARLRLLADTGTIRSEDEIQLSATDGGCEVVYRSELSLHGHTAIFNPLMGLVFERIGSRAAAGLRGFLEAE